MAGYGLVYNTLDNNKRPTNGLLVNWGQDFAGLGGAVAYIRTVVDVRAYYEVVTDLVGLLHLQGGDILGLNKCPAGACASADNYVRMLDDFKMGPNLVRGFQPMGLGPRDITSGTSNDALGGTRYWGASLEFQYPFYFLPKDAGIRGAVFINSGAEWGYQGETAWPANGEVNGTITTNTGVSYVCGNCAMQYADTCSPSRVRRRQHHLGFAVRSAAVRFRLSAPEATVRPHAIFPVRRRSALLIGACRPRRGRAYAGVLPNQAQADDR